MINLKSPNAKKAALAGVLVGVVVSFFLPAEVVEKIEKMLGK